MSMTSFSRSKMSFLENQTCVGRYAYTVRTTTIIIRSRHTFLKKLYVRISGMTSLTQHKERIINDIHENGCVDKR